MFNRIFLASFLLIGIMIPLLLVDGSPKTAFPISSDEIKKMLKLNKKELVKIFNEFSLKELTEFAQTNKTTLKAAGEYFHETYLCRFHNQMNYMNSDDGLNISCFASFMQNIRVNPLFTTVFRKHHFLSIKGIVFSSFILSPTESIRNVLKKVKTLQLHECGFKGDFYKSFLRNATKLERLLVTDSNEIDDKTGERIIVGKSDKWLGKTYEYLNHFELISNRQIKDVINFLKNHSNIKTFSTTIEFLIENMEMIKSSRTIKLDNLAILHRNWEIDDGTYKRFFNDLFILHGQNFYTELHLYYKTDVKIYSTPLLEFVTVVHVAYGRCETLKLHHMLYLKKAYLHFLKNIAGIYSDHKLKRLDKLEYVFFGYEHADHIHPFIRNIPNLKRIEMGHYGNKLYIINITSLSNQRAESGYSHRVTIYVPEPVFLYTRSEFPEMKTELIEVKRRESLEEPCSFFWKDY